MSTEYLLSRSYGDHRSRSFRITETTYYLYSLHHSPVSFHQETVVADAAKKTNRSVAHSSGVNAIAIDRFEGRYLLSGGADSSIALWDLDSSASPSATYQPMLSNPKTSEQHKLGISQVAYYPFDSLAFLTSSYDKTVKIYSSETLVPTATFSFPSVVYGLALSPIASHLLVACATQHPSVRLIDLRSGANTHALAGHSAAILSVAWSPTRDHILASGSVDGTVRFWDVRRGAAEIGCLDYEDSLGILRSPSSSFLPNAVPGKAHQGAVNGIAWTEDGYHLITAGHDERIRVWDTDTGANTLVNFGPRVRNQKLAPAVPVLAPNGFVGPGQDVMIWPNENEIHMYELFDGRTLKMLRRKEEKGKVGGAASSKNGAAKVMALAWRAHNVELYSAHSDGSIVGWKPKTEEEEELDDEEEEAEGREKKEEAGGRGDTGDNSKKRKRGALEEIYLDLTKQKITFGW